MIEVRRFEDLGRFENDWLRARYHFNFANYYDPQRTGIGPLRVWNDDRIRPRRGFDPHPHRDMEIITYVRRGAITHQDHLGNQGRTAAGDVQVMSAGRGIVHAEYNLEAEDTELFQIWIEPNQQGLAPQWAARRFPSADRAGSLATLASGRQEPGDALTIYQDAALLGATLRAAQSVRHALGPDRRAYLVPARGNIAVNGVDVGPRDGVTISRQPEVVIHAAEECEILLLDLP